MPRRYVWRQRIAHSVVCPVAVADAQSVPGGESQCQGDRMHGTVNEDRPVVSVSATELPSVIMDVNAVV
jgi:hypothetical protein